MTTTIKINGLVVEFSEKVPTKDAHYFAMEKDVLDPFVSEVFANGYCDNNGLASEQNWLWSTSPLVPAVEVQRGYIEGHTSCIGRIPYNDSRAKRVVEGTLE